MSSVSLSSHLRVSSSWVSYAPSSWPAHAALTCAGSWAYQLFTSLHFLFVFLASSFPCCSHSPLLSRHPCFPNVYSWISLVILFLCKAPFQMFLYVKMRLTLIHFESLNLARPLSSPTRFLASLQVATCWRCCIWVVTTPAVSAEMWPAMHPRSLRRRRVWSCGQLFACYLPLPLSSFCETHASIQMHERTRARTHTRFIHMCLRVLMTSAAQIFDYSGDDHK